MQTTLTTKTCQTTDATPKGSYLLDKVCLVVDFEGICLAMDLSEKVAVSSSLVNLVGAIGLDVIRDRFITDHPSLFPNLSPKDHHTVHYCTTHVHGHPYHRYPDASSHRAEDIRDNLLTLYTRPQTVIW